MWARRFGGLDPEASDLAGEISDPVIPLGSGVIAWLSLLLPWPSVYTLLPPLPLPLGVSVDTLDRCDCLRCFLLGGFVVPT